MPGSIPTCVLPRPAGTAIGVPTPGHARTPARARLLPRGPRFAGPRGSLRRGLGAGARRRDHHDVMTSGLSEFIVVLLVIFLAVGSGVLLWDGLAAGGLRHGRGAALQDADHARARLAAGIVGFAISAWALLGLLTHAR